MYQLIDTLYIGWRWRHFNDFIYVWSC